MKSEMKACFWYTRGEGNNAASVSPPLSPPRKKFLIWMLVFFSSPFFVPLAEWINNYFCSLLSLFLCLRPIFGEWQNTQKQSSSEMPHYIHVFSIPCCQKRFPIYLVPTYLRKRRHKKHQKFLGLASSLLILFVRHQKSFWRPEEEDEEEEEGPGLSPSCLFRHGL